ncbi:MAG: hypothetical protein ACLT4Y_12115 [Bifidobacterium breve]
MDIAATTLAAGIVALVAPALIQTFKVHPRDMWADVLRRVSCSASSPSPPPTASTATDGASSSPVSSTVAQAVYTLVNQAFSGKLRKDETQA